MVSLREGQLRLIGLRGAFAIDGKPVGEVALEDGLRIQLARGLWLEVVAVELPETVLGVDGAAVATRQVLPGVCSVVAGPRLVKGWKDPALAWIWSTGAGWSARVSGGAARIIAAGDRLTLPDDSGLVRFVDIPLHAAGRTATRQQGGVDAPLHLIARYDTVAIHRDGEVVSAFGGIHARVIGELVSMDGSAPWRVLAGELWNETDDALLRSRLDVTLSRLRRRLRKARVRTDLVRSDGAGTVELLLYPHDSIEDRT